ncbi:MULTISPECIES: class I SAM-dependent methyltransferase [unclassified Nocardia]|uniref:class I SAM-dependent methyltransferase n=1 Tax=unclassified Nocardia TaxID=2637762 RepID=UPI001CE4AF38|nr:MULTISPECIES: methyltransferase domain-containing protein [unclassified Nocardia]
MRCPTVSAAGLALGAGAAAAVLWFGDRAPFPYGQRWMLDIPLPLLTAARLDAVLRPRAGERILEIGPGTGLQSLHVAPQLGADGQLDVLDIQPAMLEHVRRRAEARSITNIVGTQGDARDLPFPDNTFDAMYLITALGEVPEPERVLREAVRVLNPAGRLVVGEFFDPHWIPFGRLHTMADSCGLHLAARSGPTVAYLARFQPCTGRPVARQHPAERSAGPRSC